MSKSILKEILIIAVAMIPVCLLMVGIFYLVGHGDYTVWIGAAVGYLAAMLYYFLLALTITIAYKSTNDASKAKSITSASYVARLLVLAVIVIIAIRNSHINYIAVIIPLVFPRIIITVSGLLQNKVSAKKSSSAAAENTAANESTANAAAGTYVEGDIDDDLADIAEDEPENETYDETLSEDKE